MINFLIIFITKIKMSETNIPSPSKRFERTSEMGPSSPEKTVAFFASEWYNYRV